MALDSGTEIGFREGEVMSHVLIPMIEKQVQRTIAGCPPGLHCSGFLALSLFADGIVNIPVGNKTDNTVPKALDLNSLSPELGVYR